MHCLNLVYVVDQKSECQEPKVLDMIIAKSYNIVPNNINPNNKQN